MLKMSEGVSGIRFMFHWICLERHGYGLRFNYGYAMKMVGHYLQDVEALAGMQAH